MLIDTWAASNRSCPPQIMVHLVDGVLPENYFANNLQALSVDMAVFRDLLRDRLPELSKHLDALQKEANEDPRGLLKIFLLSSSQINS